MFWILFAASDFYRLVPLVLAQGYLMFQFKVFSGCCLPLFSMMFDGNINIRESNNVENQKKMTEIKELNYRKKREDISGERGVLKCNG